MSGSRSVLSRAERVRRRPLRSLSARAAWYAASAWSCRCGTGASASTVSGVAWSPPIARDYAPDRLPTARLPRRPRPGQCGSRVARVVAASEAPGRAVSTEPTHAPAALHRAGEPPGHGPGAATSRQSRLAGGARQQARTRGPGAVAGLPWRRAGGRRDLHAAAGGARACCPRRRRGSGQRGDPRPPGNRQAAGGPGDHSPATVALGDTVAERLDLDAVLARKPQVALVDELAHRNPPGPGHATRWQDAAELLAAGIDVISTVSIGQLDSVADVCPGGREYRRAGGPATGSSTSSSPLAAWCSSHSRIYRSMVPVRAASSAEVAGPSVYIGIQGLVQAQRQCCVG
jgi:Osmosensitive K+ channel His kinase sensor domain